MRAMPNFRQLAFAVLIVTASACASEPEALVHDISVNPGYHVVGNQVLDKNGAVHYFHGVDRPSLEWSTSGENISAGDFKAMAAWKANVVRIALNQDSWLFGNGVKGYQTRVQWAVEWAKRAGLDVILDLHWSDQGGSVSPDQQKMADVNSIAFWKSVADLYKDDGRVLFELYNEPHDISWEVWLNGGDAGGFTAVGMQQLYDAVRSTGANNIVIAGGLDWAFDLSGVATHLIQGVNIMYATHPYGMNNWKPISSFDSKWGYLTASYPVIATEFGDGNLECTTDYTSAVIDYADRNGAHWTAWAWYVGGCKFPSLIVDWSGAPSAAGQVVKDALLRYATQGMPVTADGGIEQPKLDAGPRDLPPAMDIPSGADGPGRIDLASTIDLPTADVLVAID
jgi:endoglucanase